MQTDLLDLKIEKSFKVPTSERSSKSPKWIMTSIGLVLFLAAIYYSLVGGSGREEEVQTQHVTAASSGNGVILSATGYIVAHHKIQVASKVLGKVAWIGVEKGDEVKEGQVIVRLEDDEFRAQLQQAQGNAEAVQARMLESKNGSRPEEIDVAQANLQSAQADFNVAKITFGRTQKLMDEGLIPRQQYDDAKSRFDYQTAHMSSLERTYQLTKLGTRKEALQQAQGQVRQANGQLDYYKTQLDDTVIRAPITGTILERVVEKGEFVTTGFVGDRGAKGYVVSMADLHDLQVELDINQADFAKLARQQKVIITTDAYPDKSYHGVIDQIAPEANRQKGTVQVKVKVDNPDGLLRPEMNASVAFVSDESPVIGNGPTKAAVYVPLTAVRNGAVFVVIDGKAVRRAVMTGAVRAEGVRVEQGLVGGEDIIVAPTSEIHEGVRVKARP